jgi:hypothetical protein
MIFSGTRRIEFGITKQQQSQRWPAEPPYFRRPARCAFQEEWNEYDNQLLQQASHGRGRAVRLRHVRTGASGGRGA